MINKGLCFFAFFLGLMVSGTEGLFKSDNEKMKRKYGGQQVGEVIGNTLGSTLGHALGSSLSNTLRSSKMAGIAGNTHARAQDVLGGGICSRVNVEQLCVNQLVQEPVPTCPVGSELSGRFCLTSSPLQFQCPDGFTISPQGECINVVRVSKVMKCPLDFTPAVMDGTSICRKVTFNQAERVCDDSCALQNELCYPIVQEIPDFSCPPQFQLKGGNCFREEQIDCPVEVGKYRHLEARSKFQDARRCKKKARRAANKSCREGILNIAGSTCIHPVPVQPQIRCEGVAETTSACQSVQTAPVSFECPAGYKEDCPSMSISRRFEWKCDCIKHEVADPIASCPPGFELYENRCIQRSIAAFHCPKRFRLDEAGRCVQTSFSPLEFSGRLGDTVNAVPIDVVDHTEIEEIYSRADGDNRRRGIHHHFRDGL